MLEGTSVLFRIFWFIILKKIKRLYKCRKILYVSADELRLKSIYQYSMIWKSHTHLTVTKIQPNNEQLAWSHRRLFIWRKKSLKSLIFKIQLIHWVQHQVLRKCLNHAFSLFIHKRCGFTMTSDFFLFYKMTVSSSDIFYLC